MSKRRADTAEPTVRSVRFKDSKYPDVAAVVHLQSALIFEGKYGSRPFLLSLLKEPTKSLIGNSLRRECGIRKFSKATLVQLVKLRALAGQAGLLTEVGRNTAQQAAPTAPSAPPPAPPPALCPASLSPVPLRPAPLLPVAPPASHPEQPSALPTAPHRSHTLLEAPCADITSEPARVNSFVAGLRQQRRNANAIAGKLQAAIKGVLTETKWPFDDFKIEGSKLALRLGPAGGHRRWWHFDIFGTVEQGPEDDEVPSDRPDTFARAETYVPEPAVEKEKDHLRELLALKSELMLSAKQWQKLTVNVKRLYGVKVVPLYKLSAEQHRQDEANVSRFGVRFTRGVDGVEADLRLLLQARVLDATAKYVKFATLDRLHVLLSGDGAVMTRRHGEIAVTFKLLDLGREANTQENIHTAVLLAGKEEYCMMRVALRRFFDSVESIAESGLAVVDRRAEFLSGSVPLSTTLIKLVLDFAGWPSSSTDPAVWRTIPVQFALCADWKFDALLLGFNAATSNNACFLCPLLKDHYQCATSTWRQACEDHASTPHSTFRDITHDLKSIRAQFSSSTPSSSSTSSASTSSPAGLGVGVDTDPIFLTAERQVLQHLTYQRTMKALKRPALISLCRARKLIDSKTTDKSAGTKDQLVERLCQAKFPLTTRVERLIATELQDKASFHGYNRLPILRGLSLLDVILDTLHLLLRAGDRLLLLLFTMDVFPKNLEDLVLDQMALLNVHFDYFPAKDPQKGDGVTAWTSIQGDAMDAILRNLDIVSILGKSPRAVQIKTLWTDLMALLDRLDDFTPPTLPADLERALATLQSDLDKWHEDFLKLYGNNDFTPYLHLLCSHSVAMVRRHGGLRKFKCQSSEKHNNMHQKAWHRCTNKGGGRQTMSEFNRLPEYQILAQDFRARDPANMSTAEFYHCPCCNLRFTRYGDLFNHVEKKHHSYGEVDKQLVKY